MEGVIILDCEITNGKVYVMLDDNGTPKTCSEAQAQRFSEDKAKNIVNNLPKTMQKFHFKVKLIPDIPAPDKITKDEQSKETIDQQEILAEFDDFYDDYTSNEKQNNPYVYKGKTTLETKVAEDDIPGFMKTIVDCMSEINDYINNMKYFEKECDLRILDLRHFIRDSNTRLGTVAMARIGYLLQDYERKRARYKKNRNCVKLFQMCFSRLKDPNYIFVLNKIDNSEYHYRRLSKEYLEGYAKGTIKEEN